MSFLLFVTFLLFGLSLLYMLIHWPADPTKTFSQNAARHKSSVYFYGIILAIFLGFLSVFVYRWLLPSLKLRSSFGIVFAIGAAAEMIAGLVPETGGTRTFVHLGVSGLMYVSTVILVGIIAFSPALLIVARMVAALAFILMITMAMLAALMSRVRKCALVLQTIHLTSFFLVLVVLTYVR